MNEDTRYIVDRIIDEGHMIGSHTSTHRNLQYGNQTVLEEEIVDAHNFFKEYLGFQPKIFRPPYGGIDDRSHKLLEEYGYSIIMWSSGCVDWWFTDNDKDLETSIAAMRYSQAEMGSIVCMHDTAEAPNKGERLRKFLDDTWNFWNYVDLYTCLDRSDVDEGKVFKTYTEYKRAVAEDAAKLVAGDSTGSGGTLFAKSSKTVDAKAKKAAGSGSTKAEKVSSTNTVPKSKSSKMYKSKSAKATAKAKAVKGDATNKSKSKSGKALSKTEQR